MNPEVIRRADFQSGNSAVINKDLCTECDLCRELCRFKAISADYIVSPINCEGCGVCVYFCPEKAIDFPENTCGEWFVSDTRFGPMVHARLGIAEENSGKLVTLVRREARKIAEEKKLDLILTDGPPGVGCPVIASIGGASAVLIVTEPTVSGKHDMERVAQLADHFKIPAGGASAVLIVTEPTVSGKHDMERVAQLADHFKIPAMICVNKFDLNLELTRDIENYAKAKGLSCLGRIPFDPVFTKAMIQAQTVFEYDGQSTVGEAIRSTWQRLAEKLELG